MRKQQKQMLNSLSDLQVLAQYVKMQLDMDRLAGGGRMSPTPINLLTTTGGSCHAEQLRQDAQEET